MYNDERENRRLYVASFFEDQPSVSRGSLIPRRTIYSAPAESMYGSGVWYLRPVFLLTLSVFIFALSLGSAGYSVLRGDLLAAAPIVYVQNKAGDYEPEPLTYGVKLELSEPNFFADTKEQLLFEESTFIEADLTTMTIVYYEDGRELYRAPILSKGKPGSWWQTPAGFYGVEEKRDSHFSSFGNVYQPWSLIFQGNFFIHGWPEYPDGSPVPEGYSGGCIRLDTADAKVLYELVAVDTPVLVHEEAFESDGFVYEPKVPEVSASEYLLADVESNTVLASSDLEGKAPIASITKLMTALIAAEYINLDRTIILKKESYITSLVPRLSSGSRVSMYSLLQLLLVESSNEAAEVIAGVVGRDLFIERMNEKAKAIGLASTSFADPSGLSKENVSTVRDLFRLAQYIHLNRAFIFKLTADQDLPTAYVSGQFGELINFNEIEDVNFIGGKVGETEAAGITSLSLHKLKIKGEERTIVVVLLNSKDREEDIRRLIGYVRDRFSAE